MVDGRGVQDDSGEERKHIQLSRDEKEVPGARAETATRAAAVHDAQLAAQTAIFMTGSENYSPQELHQQQDLVELSSKHVGPFRIFPSYSREGP